MARFFITGARSPAAWDIAINLKKNGHQVHLADSLSHSIGKLCPAIEQFHIIPSPKTDLHHYSQSICRLLQQYQIDYLLPTCEEVFYISAIKKELSSYAEILCADIDVLTLLHNKRTLREFTWGDHVYTPLTQLLEEVSTIQLLDLSKYILKKEYCRFGTDVNLNPSFSDIANAQALDQKQNRYLLQEKIIGVEICCYAIITKGSVSLCACYLPKYRVAGSARIFFEAIEDQQILGFLQLFAKKTNYCGQISFDFIKTLRGLFLIECNPRATSGVHLCCEADLATSLTSDTSTVWVPNQMDSAQIKLAMVLFAGPRQLFSGQFRKFLQDFQMGRDVLGGQSQYSLLNQQILSLYELLRVAIKNKQTLRAASTADIEWNGQPMASCP